MLTRDVETASPVGVKSVSKKFYEIAGRCLTVEADAEWAANFAEDFIRGFHLTPSAGRDAVRADLVLNILTGTPPPLPPGLRGFEVPGGTCHTESQSYHLEVSGSRIAVGPKEARRVTVWLGDTARARRRNALITVMAYALPAALRRCGLYDLHAAGLVESGGALGFIFPGLSGSGKTSLAVRLAASGWKYLSDDLLVISEGEDGVWMRGLRRPFQTSAAALAGCGLPRLDEALGVTVPYDPEKRRLDPEVLFPGAFASAALPRVLCFPVVAEGAESRVEPLEQAEAMVRLVKMCPWSSYDVSAAREHLRVLSRLVKQCRTYGLLAGRDIFDDVAGASRLLARYV